MKSIVKTSTLLLTLLSSIIFATTYNVSGIVQLEDQMIPLGNHSGVKVNFFNLPSMDAEDSTTTNTDGLYSINISPGYYLVEWTKSGYVPWELGGLSLAENTVLDSITLIPGDVSEVSGTVNSTTWTTGFVYYITDDVTVPAGQTLTINPGVRVKFLEGKSMTVNGTLLANGTEDAHVKFTSKEPTPLPGDWGNLILNGENNVITYMDYDYATDGITGSNVSGTTINHLTILGNLALSARGIYFTSGNNLDITNNYISVDGDYAIYTYQADDSDISNNTIITQTNGIRAQYCDNCTINNNDINSNNGTTGPNDAIYAPNSNQIQVLNNTIVASYNGIAVSSSFKATINQNNITGRIYLNGIQFTSSDSSTVTGNHVERTLHNKETWDWQYLINGDDSEGSTIRLDTMIYISGSYSNARNVALRCQSSIVDSNYFNFNMHYYDNFVIQDDFNSDITNNYIESRSRSYGDRDLIRSGSSGSYVNKIENNTIIYHFEDSYRPYAIRAYSNTIVRNNKIQGDYFQGAIRVESNCLVYSNTISGDFSSYVFEVYGDSTIIRDNLVTNSGSGTGIYAYNGLGLEFKNNTFFHTGSGWLTNINNADVKIHHNLFEGNSGRGIHFENQADGEIYNNTLVSNSGDYGIYQTNQTNVPVYNNIFQGFSSGFYVENTLANYNLNNNLLWDISDNLFEGSALPPLVGQMIDQNINGNSSDIYNNIYFDPLFVDPDTNNYNIQAGSPAVNAGDAGIDADGSISDIGAYYYHIYVVMDHTALDNTDDTSGPYRVNANLTSPAGAALSGTLHYAIDGGEYAELTMTAAANDTLFYADIPGQALNTTIQYYVSATDGTHTSTLPHNISGGGFSFFVSLFSQFANMSGTSNIDGEIELTWGTSVPITGTLTGLRLYKSTSANVALTSGNLYQELDASATAYTDTETAEGVTYYYKLTGTLDSGTEALVSAEVATMSNNATTVRVIGQVMLSDATDHSGVKVLMANRYLPAIRDSMVTDLTGEFAIVMQTGIYNIHFSKDGYQPNMIGNQTFPGTAGNMDLDTTTMSPGGSLVLNGEISGTLLASDIHFVDGDITVAAGDTLIIQAGTLLKFRGEYELVVNGNIQALGTADAPILFTSGMAQTIPGDWKRLTLEGADHSVLQYCSFEYFTDGIFLKDNNHHTEISHCTFDNLLTNSRAITCRDYDSGSEYTSGNDSLTISYNETSAETYYGLFLREARGSQFVGNDFQASYQGLYCRDCSGSSFTDNTIQSSQNGLNCYNCDESSFVNNTISGQDDGYVEYCMELHDSENISVTNNTILGFWDRGIDVQGSERSVIMNNTISDTNKHGNYRNENYVIGIKFESMSSDTSQQLTIRNNNIYVIGTSDIDGMRGMNALVDSNTIIAIANNDHARGMYANYSRILDNTVYSLSNSNGRGIESYANSTYPSTIKRNTVYALGNSRAFHGNYAHIEDNVFYGTDNNHWLWDMTTASPNYNRDYWAVSDGPDLVVINNKFYDFGHGLNVNGTNCIIKNNVFTLNRTQGISIYNGNNTIVHKNSITLRGLDSNVDFGMRLYDSNISNVYGNTIASTESSPLGTGINIYNSASPVVNSNIVYNFDTGVNAQSDIYVLKFNMVNGTNTPITGDGLPDQAGVTATVNYNADPSDIYSNITASPVFVDLDSSTAIASTSAAINAGDLDSLDLDATIADIGAEFYNYGYAPFMLQADSTKDGAIYLSWNIIPTDSVTGYQPYYKLSGTDTWAPTATPVTDKTAIVENLTNNTSYDFAVTALYFITESNKSPAIQAKPGVPELNISPRVLIANSNEGDSTAVPFVISNTGSKDLSYGVVFNSNLGTVTFTKENYADYNSEENQDRITDNVWITRQNNRPLYNAAVQECYYCTTFDGEDYRQNGLEWRYGFTGNSDYPDYTNDLRSLKRNYGIYEGSIYSVHLIEEDIYFDLEFHSWSTGQQGGYSYTRTHASDYGSSISADAITGTIAPDESETLSAILSNGTSGLYAGTVALESNDPIHPTDTLHTLNIVGSTATLSSLHFTPIDTTTEVFYYVIRSASIDDYSLETGDEIALFDGDVCVGAGMYNGVMPFLVKAWGTVPPDEPGFDNGDSITVQAWDFGESRIASIEATHLSGSETFLSGGFEEVSLTGTIYHTQDIAIQGGVFNLISSYLYPELPSSSTFFGGLVGLRIVYEDNGSALIPEYGINTIGDIELTEGYHIFADGSNQTLTVSGLAINPSDWSITLQPSQFNSIAYLHNGPMDAELAMAGIANVVNIVQDDAGNAWIPELGIIMGNLNPGKGYQVFTTSDTAVTFSYGTYVTPTARVMAEKSIPTQYSFQKTGSPYTIVIQSAVTDGHPLESGDEIAVFDGNLCVGATVWDSETTNIISAWKGNSDYELPGYTPGNTMTFQVYKSRFKTAVDVVSNHPTAEEKAFNGSSYSRTSISGSPGLIPEQFALMQNYPNPFNPITNIRYNVADDSPVTMVVYNIMGQEVIRLMNNDIHAPGKYSIVWNGLNQRGETVGAGMYLIRMVSGGFSDTRKMVLLK